MLVSDSPERTTWVVTDLELLLPHRAIAGSGAEGVASRQRLRWWLEQSTVWPGARLPQLLRPCCSDQVVDRELPR